MNVWLRWPAAVLAEQEIWWGRRCPLQDFLDFEVVSSGRGSESWPAQGAAFGGRLAEAGVQIGRLEVVRLGEAGNEGLGPLARAREDLDGQLGDWPFEIIHRVVFLGWGAWVLAVTSRGTASSSAWVIFSVPVRTASIADLVGESADHATGAVVEVAVQTDKGARLVAVQQQGVDGTRSSECAETHIEHLAITRKTVTALADGIPAKAASPDLPEHPDYPRILAVFNETTGSLRARGVCEALDHELLPRNIEGTRDQAETPGQAQHPHRGRRRQLRQEAVTAEHCDRQP